MFQTRINNFIKTPCGRAKFLELSTRKGWFARLRVLWFVFCATIRDLPLPNPDQLDESNS